jgi:Protein of unknown function (DUF4238)
MGSKNRRQHYVPQFYLSYFADPMGYLWVYEAGRPSRRSRPEEAAHQRDYYALEADGTRNNLVDDYLKRSESAAGAILPRLAVGDQVNESEWSDLCIFVGLLFARVPAARKYADRVYGVAATSKFLAVINNTEEFSRLFEQSKHRIIGPATAEEFRQKLIEGYRLDQDSQYHNLVTMLEIAQDAVDSLSRLDWEVAVTGDDELFVTADNPVVTVTPDGHGWAKYGDWFDAPGMKVLFPLSPHACLVLQEHGSVKRRVLPPRMIRCVNSALMALAGRFMFASEPKKALERAFDKKGCQSEYSDGKFVRVRPEWLV